MAANGYRPPTRRQLAEEEHLIDQVRGRRHCEVHPHQQMIPLLPGVDVCPGCIPEQRPHEVEQRPGHAHPSKGHVAETPEPAPHERRGTP